MEEKEETRKMEKEGQANWSEEVEDLVEAGDTQGAISLLENIISKLETTSSSSLSSDDLRLASALSDLASLYSSVGFSLKSDQLLSRATLLKLRVQSSSSSNEGLVKKEGSLSTPDVSLAGNDKPLTREGNLEKLPKSNDDASPTKSSSEDDWEAIADREPNVLLSSECLPGVSNFPLEDSKAEAPKRRGRGTFSYNKSELYSDRLSDISVSKDADNEDVCISSGRKTAESKYGTRHVLVLADFSPRTTTTDLEKHFDSFRDRGFVLRWVNDTTALAVFSTPSIAIEASKNVCCPFTVRILEDDDILLGSIKERDLEPPRQRPQTSARTAQRLIAQGTGLKLPSSSFGSRELRNQEEARRNRIVTRQKLRDDAWGDD